MHNDMKKLLRSRERSKQRKPTLRAKHTCGVRGARIRGLDFDISFAEYSAFITKNPSCGYCDVDLLNLGGCSLDRIDNAQGYRLGNVIPCCGPCNTIRGNNLTVFEMQVAMDAVIKYRKSLKTTL